MRWCRRGVVRVVVLCRWRSAVALLAFQRAALLTGQPRARADVVTRVRSEFVTPGEAVVQLAHGECELLPVVLAAHQRARIVTHGAGELFEQWHPVRHGPRRHRRGHRPVAVDGAFHNLAHDRGHRVRLLELGGGAAELPRAAAAGR